MQNYVKYGEVNRILALRRRAEERDAIIRRLMDVFTGVVIGAMIVFAITLIR